MESNYLITKFIICQLLSILRNQEINYYSQWNKKIGNEFSKISIISDLQVSKYCFDWIHVLGSMRKKKIYQLEVIYLKTIELSQNL